MIKEMNKQSYFKKTINYIISKNIEKIELQNIIVPQKKYLSPGRYSIISSVKTYVYLKNNETKKFLNNNESHLNRKSLSTSFNFKMIIFLFISKFFTIKIKNDNNESTNKGSLVMVTKNKDLKIFDFINKRVISHVNNETYNNIRKAHYKFRRFFDMPIISFSDHENIIIEEYIDFIPYSLWSKQEKESAIKLVFENYKKYFIELSEKKMNRVMVGDILDTFKKEIEHNILFSKIKFHISLVDDEDRLPITSIHGDINFYNILLNNNKYSFIDWEYYDNNVFFYDFFNIMFVEYSYQNDRTYIEDFFQGEYDVYFFEIFSVMGLKYYPSNRLYYFVIYMVEMILKSKKIMNHYELKTLVDKCTCILTEIESIYSVQ